MRILYDYQAFDMQRIGGVSRCFIENFKHFSNDVNATIGVLESDNVYMQSLGYKPVGYHREHFISTNEFPGKGRMFRAYNRLLGKFYGQHENRLESIRLLKKGGFDVFHPTFFDDYFLKHLDGKPFVLTIHDMIPELYPEFFGFDNEQILQKKKLAPLASKIIAVSETTKQDIVHLLKINEDKIDVVYHGVDVNAIKWQDKSFFEFPYLLYVGARNGYKGFCKFCQDITPILKDLVSLKVVCTGADFSFDELNLFKRLGCGGYFIHKFAVDDMDLNTLYKHATAFVFTSEYEGFGIPILEAFGAECPVVLNKINCFTEVAGDAAVYYDSKVEGSLKDAIMYVINLHDDERRDIIGKQKKRLELFSWDKSANKICSIYKSLT